MSTYSKDDRYRPFSNGTEHMMWLESNCCRGEKGCRNYRPNATSSRHGCPIEVAIVVGGCIHGDIPARIALRADFLRPGPNGLLTDDHLWVDVDDGKAFALPLCPEYRGYDEPDDRPHRGPRPSKDQLDLLDPRGVPEQIRERVA